MNNGLYHNEQEKKNFYGNQDRIVNAFWVSILGILGIKIIEPKNSMLIQELNRNYTYMTYAQDVYQQTDDMPDFLLSIKILREMNLINQLQAQSLFKFLDSCRSSGFKKIDQSKLRQTLKLLPLYKIRPAGFISDSVYDFLSGKTDLEFITYRLFLYNEQLGLSGMISHYGNLFKEKIIKFGNE